MNKFFAVGMIAVVAFVFSGCATIFKGDSSSVGLNSNPMGATVYADSAEVCSATPCSVMLKSDKSWHLLFKKAGHKDKTVLLNNKIGAGWIILDVIFGLIPVIIDAATGAWYGFDFDNVTVTLEQE